MRSFLPNSDRFADCVTAQASFSEYLDGSLSGVAMTALAGHLDACPGCAGEFAAWRSMQDALANLGPARPPLDLQARLRDTIGSERARETHVPRLRRWGNSLQTSFDAFALQAAGGVALALVLVGGLSWLFAAPLAAVEANDEHIAHLNSPHYLYSQVPPQPIVTQNDVPILVDAKVNTEGRVYDFSIVAGPVDPDVTVRVEENLLASIFRPATVFGVPVPGHVMMTYSGVSVRG